MHKLIKSREIKINETLIYDILKSYESSLQLSSRDEFEFFHKSSISSIDIEAIENRYILSGNGAGTISIHDLHKLPNLANNRRFPIVASINLNHEQRHLFSISRVQWHSIDNGLFTTSSADKLIKIWDTNALKVASQIQLSEIINSHEMSSSLLLIALAMNGPKIQLVDLRCGTAIHSLNGHSCNKGVFRVSWRPFNEHHLVSGGKDGKIILWDIRRSKSFVNNFDQHNSQIISASNASDISAHEGSVLSLKFLSPHSDQFLSLGSDSSARLWDAQSGRNLMLNYGHIPAISSAIMQLDISKSGCIAYIPSRNDIFVLNILTGENYQTLRGHFSQVLCCMTEPLEGNLISGGRDNNLLMWRTKSEDEQMLCEGKLDNKNKFSKRIAFLDQWSDED